MTATHPSAPAAPAGSIPVRARIGQDALAKVSRFFSASLGDVFTELLRNARRAGATRVAVATECRGATARVAVADDGRGMADPALAFGGSGREDPAGMGLLSLAQRGCVLRSRARDPGPLPSGWRMALAPAHFLGEAEAQALIDETAPWGTEVTFDAEEGAGAVEAALAAAARHFPLPVALDGRTLPRRAFLDGALHAEPWRGLVFGVYRDRCPGYAAPDLCVHGVTLRAGLPAVGTVEGGVWSVRADVNACPERALMLPARKEAVETPFLRELRDAARRAVYRAIANAEPGTVRVARDDWRRAAEAGIALPEPPAALRPWRPDVADPDRFDALPAFAAVDGDTLVMEAELEPPEAQALFRALQRAGLAPRVRVPEPRFAGFAWYDRLARVRGVSARVSVDGRTCAPSEVTVPEGAIREPRPEAVVMKLRIAHPQAPGGEAAFEETRTLPADLAFAGAPWAWVGAARPLVTRDSGITPETLAELLRAAFFCPSDAADADVRETRSTRFDEEALHAALLLLASEDEARRRTIAEAVARELLWLFPADRQVDVSVRNGRVAVAIGPAPA